ncbi:hypothetical protein Ancab_035555 [Ancistrocladus abbreviatus]
MNTSGRFVPRSCSTSALSFYGSANGYRARSTTPNKNRSDPMYAAARDKVLGPNVTSEEVYEVAARPVVKAAMEGVNGTVFAYGVTSSEKTQTMHTPRREFLLRVSYLKIYNEIINDLLDPIGQNLRVREDAQMIESSAHSDEYDGVIFSQLNLIDLARSESSKTKTTGLRRKEGSYINKSLLTLGTLIRTVTHASSSMEETHNTLKFASRAKRVEIYASRNKLEEGQVKMQSRLDEEEEAKAALMSRIQRLTKLILVSTKNAIPGYLGEVSGHQRSHSAGEDDISEVFRDGSLHVETENHKDSPSSTVADASGDSRHKRSSNKWKDDLSPASSTVTESNQAGKLISGSKLPTGEMIMSDEMDLLVEQVKMLAGDIVFSTSTLKHLLEQSVNDPDALKTQNMECEIQEKRRQMRILEQRIIQSGEASVSNASLVDMQQWIHTRVDKVSAANASLLSWCRDPRAAIKSWEAKKNSGVSLGANEV